MNTKTMRLPPRRGLMSTSTTTAAATTNAKKRKEREGFDNLTRPSPTGPITAQSQITKLPKPSLIKANSSDNKPASSNLLLAGYLAHMYLTKGSLFGQKWDPNRTEEEPGPKKGKPSQRSEAEPSKKDEEREKEEIYQRYVEVSNLLRMNGTHLPGIVNPTQLVRYLRS